MFNIFILQEGECMLKGKNVMMNPIKISGESFVSLHQQYRTGHSSVGKIVKATAEALYLEFKDEYLSVCMCKILWH